MAFKPKSSGTYIIKSYQATGLVNLQFKTEAVIRSGANNDYIVRVYHPTYAIAGTINSENLFVGRVHETSTRYTYCGYVIGYTLLGHVSGVARVHTHVGNNGYKTSNIVDDIK